MTRRASTWRPGTVGPNAATLPSLPTLRARSRDAARNDPYGSRAIKYRTAQLVGTGITPKSLAPDEAFRARVQALWLAWSATCDAEGRADFPGLQMQATRCWQEAGEVFVRLRARLPSDGLPVPLQLEVLEPELCPSEYTRMQGANRIRAGIELSPINQRVAYWFYRAHPADGDLTPRATELVRLDATRVLQVALPERPGQLRGVPHLAPALLTFRDLELGDDATLLRWQTGNMFMATFKRGATTEAGLNPLTGQAIERDAQDRALVSMEPATVVELQPDETLDFNDPPEAGQTYEAFTRQVLRKLAAATDVPYHALTGDLAQVNDRTIRVILQDFRRSLEQLQWSVLVHQLCRPIWTEWFETAVRSEALAVPAAYWRAPAVWQDVEWAPDRWAAIHPVQDVEADVAEVRAGFASRMLKVKGRGYDVEEIDRQRSEDNARDRRLSLVSESDASATDRSGKIASETATPPPGSETDDLVPGG